MPSPTGFTHIISFPPHADLKTIPYAREEAEAQCGSLFYRARSHIRWSQHFSLVPPAPHPVGPAARRRGQWFIHRDLTLELHLSGLGETNCFRWKKKSPNSSVSKGAAQSGRNCEANGPAAPMATPKGALQEWGPRVTSVPPRPPSFILPNPYVYIPTKIQGCLSRDIASRLWSVAGSSRAAFWASRDLEGAHWPSPAPVHD